MKLLLDERMPREILSEWKAKQRSVLFHVQFCLVFSLVTSGNGRLEDDIK